MSYQDLMDDQAIELDRQKEYVSNEIKTPVCRQADPAIVFEKDKCSSCQNAGKAGCRMLSTRYGW